MISALQRYAPNIQTLICHDNNAILRQIGPQCTSIETLVLGKITLEVLPILRLCKDVLVRLEFTPERRTQPLTYTRSSNNNNCGLMPGHINELLDAIMDLSKLEHLVLDYIGLKSDEQLDSFFTYCQRLFSLELHQTAVFGAAPSTLVFNNMRSISFIDCAIPLSDQLMLMMQCPHLNHITWIRKAHILPMEMMGTLMKVERRELKSLNISNGVSSDLSMATALAQLTSLETLIARATQFGPASMTVLLDYLSSQLQVLDLMDCHEVASEMVDRIMGTCTTLKSLSMDRVRALDVIEHSQWVCDGLEELRVVFVGPSCLSSNETQHAIYNKIATLRRLRVLSLGRNGSTTRWSAKSVLDLSLAGGLGQLAPLTELREFDFCQMPHRLGMGEFKFMLRCWPKLETMHGHLNADRDRAAFVESYLRNERPGIRLRNNLRYGRNPIQTELGFSSCE
ncbi:hypothetical protein BGZ54_007012 [Gamsiella multidivaricata]|nr:hypothetical protein BGZ54_007012 [Gamsiella multidivaricata]